VLVVDGAGGTAEASSAVATAVEQAQVPLYVRSFAWTHGVGRGISDMTDMEHAQVQAALLADRIRRYRAKAPGLPVYLIGYSAGANVALEATRHLDPNSLERIILLAPAVATDYDLRPAFAASRQGIDVFTSRRDRFFLGLGTSIIGTADGKSGVPPAGRVGFDMPPIPAAVPGPVPNLRQYSWDWSVAWSGNLGGHAGSLRPDFFRAYVLPLLR
jgi:pimeloyl-ACP methyl ester carboxylesterase